MPLVFGALSPHPPIIIPEVGRGETKKVQNTIRALQELADRVRQAGVESIVLVTPHGPVFQDAIALSGWEPLAGSFHNFGASGVRLSFPWDKALTEAIYHEARRQNLPVTVLHQDELSAYRLTPELDHGALVPLYYLARRLDVSVVHMGMGLLPFADLYAFGKAIQRAAAKDSRRIAMLASGDLSHRLTPDAPAGYNPKGAEFDREIVAALRRADIEHIFRLSPALCEGAGECGLRPIIILLGALDGLKVLPEVLSYEGPFGVGYAVASFAVIGEDPARAKVEELYRRQKLAIAERRRNESPFVRLARESLEHYVRTGRQLPLPADLPKEMQRKAGVFVSIKKHGELRGCIGTTAPTAENIAAEIIQNAVSAGTGDPRFFPVEENELPELVYSVDVLNPPEPVKSMAELDPQKYGVIVKQGHRSGLLLPMLEGIDTPEEQVAIARRKAGIDPDEKIEMWRFAVERYY